MGQGSTPGLNQRKMSNGTSHHITCTNLFAKQIDLGGRSRTGKCALIGLSRRKAALAVASKAREQA